MRRVKHKQGAKEMFRLRHKLRQRRLREEANRQIGTAADLKVDEEAVVKALNTAAEPRHVSKLMALGILPGTKLVLLQRFPTLVLKAGETVLAVDETLGRLIEVDRGK